MVLIDFTALLNNIIEVVHKIQPNTAVMAYTGYAAQQDACPQSNMNIQLA